MKENESYLKSNKAITLIALVITIIVLLILAGVTIATLTGENGLLQKAGESRNTNIDAEIEEEIRLAWNKVYTDSFLDNTIEQANALKTELESNRPGETAIVNASKNKINVNYRGKDKVLDTSAGILSDAITIVKAKQQQTIFDDNTSIIDSYGNKCIVPKGFKISSGSAEIVTEGIVIEDATYENTIGSEFVWIPVSKDSTDANKIKGTKGNKTITLGRYVFDSDGNVDTTLSKSNPQEQLKQDKSSSVYYTEGLKDSTTSNAHAKDIEDFITKTNAAGGFWIGRYEARTSSTVARTSSSQPLTPVTEKPENSVYNYILQKNASIKAGEMYEENNYFESDLMNSYAWDTAILFLQEYDNRTYNTNTNSNYKEKYSRQTRLSTGLKNWGTNASNISNNNKDKICNVFDIADNCLEWTTETGSGDFGPCVRRGGWYVDLGSYVKIRFGDRTGLINDRYSFRPLLYVK